VAQALAVFVGGGLGALSRWSVGLWLARGGAFPLGTLAVNVVGCLALGFLGEVFVRRAGVPEPLALALTTGFLGGLTTFSTFGYESVRLARDTSLAMAAVNVGANVVVGLGCAALGAWIGARTAGAWG
jgi:CrcB protein